MVNFDDVRVLCKPGKSPSRENLDIIQEYVLEAHRISWVEKNNRVSLKEFTEQVIRDLEIDVIFCENFFPRFLFNAKKVSKIFGGKGDDDFFYIPSTETDGYYKHEERFYLPECVVTYYVRDGNNYQLTTALHWLAPDLDNCPECRKTFVKHEMVYNEITDSNLDLVCDTVVNSRRNVKPSLEDPIRPYHSHIRSWRFTPQRAKKEKSIPFGVEIEIHSKESNDSAGANLSAIDILKATEADDPPNFYFEWDGSLMNGGFEMVTNPMTLEYGSVWWNRMLPILRKHCVGYGVEKLLDEGVSPSSINYGIHLTISRKNISDSLIAKLAKFFDYRENSHFLWCIAQRARMYGGYNLGYDHKPSAKNTMFFSKKVGSKLTGKDRRQPINVKPTLVEFRMFQSTLNTVSFLKNIEFLDALISYYKEHMGYSVNYRDFLVWLNHNTKRYPNLVLYLKHPVFYVKGVGNIKNEWSELLATKKVHNRIKPVERVVYMYQDESDKDETSMVGA